MDGEQAFHEAEIRAPAAHHVAEPDLRVEDKEQLEAGIHLGGLGEQPPHLVERMPRPRRGRH